MLALEPHCVVYSPLHLDAAEVAALLGVGVNVVTTAELMTGSNLDRRRE